MKLNELKVTQVELFQFFHFMCITANASKFFCMTHLASIERFFYHFQYEILCTCKVINLS